MSIQIEDGSAGAEADHRIANNLASLSGVIRLQRNAISRSDEQAFTTTQVCMLLDDIGARIEVTAKLHKSLALATNGAGELYVPGTSIAGPIRAWLAQPLDDRKIGAAWGYQQQSDMGAG